MSLARLSVVDTAAMISGNQTTVFWMAAVAFPLRTFENINAGNTSADAKLITNHGMTCTKRIVFAVATLVFREFNPIHMPNQASAARLARTVKVPAADIASANHSFGAVIPPAETITVPPMLVVVTTVTFVIPLA